MVGEEIWMICISPESASCDKLVWWVRPSITAVPKSFSALSSLKLSWKQNNFKTVPRLKRAFSVTSCHVTPTSWTARLCRPNLANLHLLLLKISDLWRDCFTSGISKSQETCQVNSKCWRMCSSCESERCQRCEPKRELDYIFLNRETHEAVG